MLSDHLTTQYPFDKPAGSILLMIQRPFHHPAHCWLSSTLLSAQRPFDRSIFFWSPSAFLNTWSNSNHPVYPAPAAWMLTPAPFWLLSLGLLEFVWPHPKRFGSTPVCLATPTTVLVFSSLFSTTQNDSALLESVKHHPKRFGFTRVCLAKRFGSLLESV